MANIQSDGASRDTSTWNWVHWVGVILSLGIAAINIFIGYSENQPQFFIIGGSFLVGVVLFVTRFWNPLLYLLGILHVGILGVMWFFGGRQFLLSGVVTGILSAGLAMIAVYLFFEEGP